MVDGLIREGDLSDPRWIEVFRAVPRHAFVPCYYPMNSQRVIDGADPEQAAAWLRAVYSDTTLITQRRLDAVTSSGTMPGRFVVDLLLPDLIVGHSAGGLHDVVLTGPEGSRARHSPTGELVQIGPRRLWDEVESAHRRWQEWGSPHRERFGLSATAHEQWVWLEDPRERVTAIAGR